MVEQIYSTEIDFGSFSRNRWTDSFFSRMTDSAKEKWKEASKYLGITVQLENLETALYSSNGNARIYRLRNKNCKHQDKNNKSGVLPYILRVYLDQRDVDDQKKITSEMRKIIDKKPDLGSHFVRYMLFEKGYSDERQQEHPFYLMEFCDGDTLSAKYLLETEPKILEEVAEDFKLFILGLQKERIGLSDLSGDNLIVRASDNKVVSIDYDEIAFPSYTKEMSSEAGKKAFRHRNRDPAHPIPLNADISNFPALLIYVSLLAVAYSKEEYCDILEANQWEDQDQPLLFKESDLSSPKSSDLFKRLRSDKNPMVKFLADKLYQYATDENPCATPQLSVILSKMQGGNQEGDNISDANSESPLFERIPDIENLNGDDLLRKVNTGTPNPEEMYLLSYCVYKGLVTRIKGKEAVARWAYEAAELGHKDARQVYAKCLLHGYGVEKNEEESKKYLEATGAEVVKTQSYPRRDYHKEENVPQSLRIAVDSFLKKAEDGNAEAQYYIGKCYQNGDEVSKNPVTAAEWFAKAAKQGHVEAQYELGCCYYNGEGVPKNFDAAAKLFQIAARQEHVEAQHMLGECYYYGNGMPKAKKLAVKWYGKAANQGHAGAQFMLGKCYENGHGVPKNLVTAAEWFAKAVEQGHVEAQYELGCCYYNGEGVQKNLEVAAMLFRIAAEQQHAGAQFMLGMCYENGHGVPKNMKTAAEWFAKAVEQGHVEAQYELGCCYYNGEGVQKNLEVAVMLFQKAAEQEHARAQFMLGMCYKNGYGVPQNKSIAEQWFRKAAKQGVSEAKKYLDSS